MLGILKNDIWQIAEVVFSGPQAVHKSAEFVFDYDYTAYQANMLSELYANSLQVIGIWHSHITSSPFSYADEETNLKFAALNDFGILSCLIDLSKKTITVYHVSKNGEYTEIPYTILNDSPCEYKSFWI